MLPRIILVAPQLEILGGQGIQARDLQRYLCAEGFQAEILPVNPPFPRGLQWLRRIPIVRTLLNQALYLPRLAALRRADVVHVFSASYWSFLLAPVPAIVAAIVLRKPTLLHYHSGEAGDHLDNWGLLVHPWLARVGKIVVPSGYLGTVFGRHGYRAHVIPNVVDAGQFRFRARRQLHPRLLSTRNLEPHYRVDNTLRAFAFIKRRHPDASLVIAGYGSERKRLQALADSLGCGGIRFIGKVSPDAMPALFDSADIFVNSSVIDNQPVSILEAFAAGTCVVSTPAGDIPAMVRHARSGMLVPPDDPAGMADAVTALLEDPDRAVRMTRAAHAQLAGFSWNEIGRQWMALYAGMSR